MYGIEAVREDCEMYIKLAEGGSCITTNLKMASFLLELHGGQLNELRSQEHINDLYIKGAEYLVQTSELENRETSMMKYHDMQLILDAKESINLVEEPTSGQLDKMEDIEQRIRKVMEDKRDGYRSQVQTIVREKHTNRLGAQF